MNATAETFGYPGSVLHQTRHWLVLLRPAQVTLGSLVLCCTDPARRLGEISEGAASELRPVAAKIESALGTAFQHDRINYLMLMMVDPDVHFHVLPRYAKERELAGQRFVDRSWPGPPDLSQVVELPGSVREALFARLREHFA
jgi:diadenosine tetraphosphate (Ap4A) HIT family hydrolase